MNIENNNRLNPYKFIQQHLKRIISPLFSFECLFLLFLFSARFKSDPRFAWFPIDLTALFFSLSCAVAFKLSLHKKIKASKSALVMIAFSLALTAYTLISLIWTPGIVYAFQKAFYMSTLVLWSLVGAAWIISNDLVRVKRFIVLLFIFSLWMGSEALLFYLKHGQGFVTALGNKAAYLGLGRVIGLGCIIAFFHALQVKPVVYERFYTTAFLFLLFLLLVIGARGPLLATIIPLAIAFLSGLYTYHQSNQVLFKQYVKLLIAAIVIITLLIVILNQLDKFPYTLNRLLFPEEFKSNYIIDPRYEYLLTAFDAWLDEPIWGHGIGSFPLIAIQFDMRLYPHNIIFELLVELGLIGCIFFLCILATGFYSLYNARAENRAAYNLLVLMLVLNTLINAFLSGDFNDNRALFCMLGLLAF
jgi:O-Antigen ligase